MRRSLKLGLAAGVAAFALSGAAVAGDEAGMYGNTVVCTYPDGPPTKVYMEKGGTYSLTNGGYKEMGTWKDDGTNVCYHATNPAAAPGDKTVCIPTRDFKVGDTWSVTDPKGKVCKAELKAGHL